MNLFVNKKAKYGFLLFSALMIALTFHTQFFSDYTAMFAFLVLGFLSLSFNQVILNFALMCVATTVPMLGLLLVLQFIEWHVDGYQLSKTVDNVTNSLTSFMIIFGMIVFVAFPFSLAGYALRRGILFYKSKRLPLK